METSHTTFHGISNVASTTQGVLVLFAVVLISSAICYSFLVTDHEAPVECFVAVPEQCLPAWKGCTLDKPDIKASSPLHRPLYEYTIHELTAPRLLAPVPYNATVPPTDGCLVWSTQPLLMALIEPSHGRKKRKSNGRRRLSESVNRS